MGKKGRRIKLSEKERIANILTRDQVLRQLAEESAEVTQSALKLIRSYERTTPIKVDDAYKSLAEEIADVNCCINVLKTIYPFLNELVCENESKKMKRWINRLENKNED